MKTELPLNMPIQIMVLGAGTMGQGLALLAAKSGHRVFLVDVNQAVLKSAMELIRSQLKWFKEEAALGSQSVQDIFQRIEPAKTYKEVVSSCDLVIEAISEDEKLKADLFRVIGPYLKPQSIIASNTSYLNVFKLAPEEILPRLAIAHFYAPPYLIPLVEVVGGEKTDPEVLNWLINVLCQMGQQPVLLRRFIPGYIVNRLQRAMAREIFNLLDNGFAGPAEIDVAVQASLGLRLPVLGAVRRYDFTGLDISLKFLQNPSIDLVNDDKIPRTLTAHVDSGALGVKTGNGFYHYGNRPIDDILKDRDRRLLALRRFMESEDIPIKS